MDKKLVKFDDSSNSGGKNRTARNKIKNREATPHATKHVKSTAVSLKSKVEFDADVSVGEQNERTKNKKMRQDTPYHIKTRFSTSSNNLRKDLFSTNKDKNDEEASASFTYSSPLTSRTVKSKKPRICTPSKTGIEVQEIICSKKNNSFTMELQDSSSEESEVFNPSSDNNCSEKIGSQKRKRKLSQGQSDECLLVSNSPPTNFNNLDETDNPLSSVGDELATEELNNHETIPNIDVSSKGEDSMEDDSDEETHENSTGNYTLFKYNDVNFLVLNPNSKLYFNGLLSITVLHGKVEILGYTLTSLSGNQNVYSPRGTAHLYFEAKPCEENQYDRGFISKISELIPKEELSIFKNVAKINSCILMYKILKQQEMKFLEKHIDQTLFPKRGCTFINFTDNWNVLNVNSKWDKIADSMTRNSKLLLTGGKGVGKSTALRYLLNKLLPKFSSVVVIDLDPGQPEFTPPGCISVHIINKPVFGPNYTHLRTSYRSVFVSDLNVSVTPKNYLDRVEDLYGFGAIEAGYPTIINYVGLTKENGLDLLSTVILYVKPTIIVEIRSKIHTRNFAQPLSRDLLVNSNSYFSSRNFSTEEFPKFEIEVISSSSDSIQGWFLSSRNVREMMILNYFGKIFSEDDQNLESTPDFVYKMNISHIKLKSQYKECTINIIDQSLVAMCSDTGECFGWGIVCGVDNEQDELYIQTPLPSNQFSLISVLNKGTVSLPPCFYMAYNYPNIPNKYVCEGRIEDTGRLPMRNFTPVAKRK